MSQSYAYVASNLGLSEDSTDYLPLYAALRILAALDLSPPTTVAGVLQKLQGYFGPSPTARELLAPVQSLANRSPGSAKTGDFDQWYQQPPRFPQ